MYNQFEYFYKQQIRKDLIDKFNVRSVPEIDFSCILFYKGYISSVPSDRNFKNISYVLLSYLYTLESLFCQKVIRGSEIKKNIQRDLPSTYFFNFSCTLRDNKVIFQLLQRLFTLFYFQQRYVKDLPLHKPALKFFFNKKVVLLKNVKLSLLPWVKTFRSLEKNNKLLSSFCFNCTNLFLFYWICSRLQLTNLITNNVSKFGQTVVPLQSQDKIGIIVKLLNKSNLKSIKKRR